MRNSEQCRDFSFDVKKGLLGLLLLILLVVAVAPAAHAFKGIDQNDQDLRNVLTNPDANEQQVDQNNQNDQVLRDVLTGRDTDDAGQSSIEKMNQDFLKAFPDVSFLGKDIRDKDGRPIKGYVNPALVRGASPMGTLYPPTPAAMMGWTTESIGTQEMYRSGLSQLNGFNGNVNSDLKNYAQELQAGNFMARTLQYPTNVANQARAQALATANAAGNAMGDMAKGQSASAISYCSSFMRNFTAEEGNRWNKIRNGLFVPVAILLLLPGAVLTQMKAMVSAGNPTLGDMNPFDGILRSVVAIFLIPATFLVVNYGIDFSNSIVASIAGTYKNVMGRNMYKDALGAEFRAFPVRSPKENQNTGAPKRWPVKKIENREDYESMFVANKYVDPTVPEYIVPRDKTDEAMPAGAVAARELTFGTNAALTAAWNILCAFQMAYLAYLFFVGPIVAALWVWPMKHFRDALPNWIEGVCTVCFWSLFWNTAILLMACFKGVDESGTMITTALNFLATSSVKYAFDFAGLVKAAGQQAAQKAMEKGGAKGGAGAGGASGSKGSTGSTSGNTSGKTNGTTSGNTNSSADTNSSVNTNSSSVTPNSTYLNPTSTLNSFSPADNKSMNNPVDYQMPPLSLKTEPKLSSQTAQLGNYMVSRRMENGKEIDALVAPNGSVIAVLPTEQMIMSGLALPTVLPDGSSVKTSYNPTTGVSTYSMNDKVTASMNSMNGLSFLPAMTPVSKDIPDHALALKSQNGTLLLEDNGRTVLVPHATGGGYDSYSLQSGATKGEFALSGGRSLFIGTDSEGHPFVSVSSANGKESFAVSPDQDKKGVFIGHMLNENWMGGTLVAANGNDTVYTKIDSNGNVTDRDTIGYNRETNAYQISSEYFDPASNSAQPIGTAVRTYDAKGGYTALYRDANQVEVATATHVVNANGGFTDSVYEANKLVSVQNAVVNPNGGYDISTQRYRDGVPLALETASYDSSMNVVVPSPVVLAKSSVDNNVLTNNTSTTNTSSTNTSSTNTSSTNPSSTNTFSTNTSSTNNNVSQFMSRISNVTTPETKVASSNVFGLHELENNNLFKDNMNDDADVRSSENLQQQVASAPIANSNRPRGLAQVFNTTRPVVNSEVPAQTEAQYTW